MIVHYLKDGSLDQLKSNISNNLEYYIENEPWLQDYFKDEEWKIVSRLSIEDVELIVEPGERGKNDYENVRKIYLALKTLNLTQASDERLWAYLSHTIFWKYMQARWPVDKKIEKNSVEEFIKTRFFLISNKHRALVRNGISRLWWFGYVSYDESRKDPFELTKFMLSNQDVAQSLTDRHYANNRDFIISTLAALKEIQESKSSIITKKPVQSLAKHIQQIGGVTVLDAMDKKDMENIISRWVEKFYQEETA